MQTKSPGVQLCREAAGARVLCTRDPLLGHLIDSAGMVIIPLRRAVL
jgi:hypothetical protein